MQRRLFYLAVIAVVVALAYRWWARRLESDQFRISEAADAHADAA